MQSQLYGGRRVPVRYGVRKNGLSPDEYTRGGGAADARLFITTPRGPSHCEED